MRILQALTIHSIVSLLLYQIHYLRQVQVLQRIVSHGDTVLVLEHNLDVIKVADYIIDLGPDGGDAGGKIVATGTPEEVSNNKNSYTGQYLKKVLKKEHYE